MAKILIIGATGNVGMEVLKALNNLNPMLEIICGSKDFTMDKAKLSNFNVSLVKFDFTEVQTYATALEEIEIVFLLRPPQISDTELYFKPLILAAKNAGVQHIVFLSVQGVEKSSIIPHHKIEKSIVESGIAYTFLRPAYFMQNFTTTLRKDLVEKKLIFLPAGRAKFSLVDVRDIGRVAAKILLNTEKHVNTAYELTCAEKFSFKEMAKLLSKGLGTHIKFKSPNLVHFYLKKQHEKVPTMLILVMIMLHYFPRFQKSPAISDWVEKITGTPPNSFEKFIADHASILVKKNEN